MNRVFLGALLVVLTACGRDSLMLGGIRGDWKCSVRDSNGNPFFGVDKDKKSALDKANWQCVSGSPYKQSCTPEPAYCEQLE